MQSFLTLTGGSHQILRRGRDIMLIPRGSVIGPIPLQLFIPYIYIYIYIYIYTHLYLPYMVEVFDTIVSCGFDCHSYADHNTQSVCD